MILWNYVFVVGEFVVDQFGDQFDVVEVEFSLCWGQ